MTAVLIFLHIQQSLLVLIHTKFQINPLSLCIQASETYSKAVPDPSLPPHVFAVANQIYRSMLSERKPQGCVISGESGAGKTETSKYLVQQLLFITESEEKELNLKIEQVSEVIILWMLTRLTPVLLHECICRHYLCP